MMKQHLLCLTFFLVAAGAPVSVSKAQSTSAATLIDSLEEAIGQKDELRARLLVKQLAKVPKSGKQWWKVREILFDRPQVGYDFLSKWDRIRPKGAPMAGVEQKANALLARADKLQSEGKFQSSFRIYQTLAKLIKQDLTRGNKSQRFLYWTVVHSMARSLYGAARFKEALEVYEWIPPDYYKFRQVLFEKMWAAFRSNRFDVTLGAIASQQSSYFADYLEPETYLVQMYLYKKLCRNEEHKRTLTEIERIMKRLQPGGSYGLKEWAQSDLETKVLYRLVEAVVPEGTDRQAKLKEQDSIRKVLQNRFNSERGRLLKQFNVVLAYSRLSVAMDKELIVTDVVPNRERLLESNKEFWPVEDAEDWVDELGQHLYIGESRCGKNRK